ncbi:MAG: cobalt ECF transporter S component CbiM [Archaeoglobaceae archaeon]
MHIAEGYLPPLWAAFWYAFAAPFLIYGGWKVKRLIEEKPQTRSLLAVAVGFIFVLSALKLPSVTGSCSHPTGTGLAVVFFGPSITAVLSAIVLLYQALLLAHGGITTLGANVTSMGIVGPFFGWIAYRALRRNFKIAVFAAAVVADLTTYVVTSLQLALAFPSSQGFEGIVKSASTFMGIFAVTQIPLAVLEGFLAAALASYILEARSDVLEVVKA